MCSMFDEEKEGREERRGEERRSRQIYLCEQKRLYTCMYELESWVVGKWRRKTQEVEVSLPPHPLSSKATIQSALSLPPNETIQSALCANWQLWFTQCYGVRRVLHLLRTLVNACQLWSYRVAINVDRTGCDGCIPCSFNTLQSHRCMPWMKHERERRHGSFGGSLRWLVWMWAAVPYRWSMWSLKITGMRNHNNWNTMTSWSKPLHSDQRE